MSEKRFEDFLIEKLLVALPAKAIPGYRCQYYVPDDNYSERLVEACMRRSQDHIDLQGVLLPYLAMPQSKLLFVSDCPKYHFSENYISMLRDEVARNEGSLAGCSLMIFHSSRLDTLTNSAEDLSVEGAVWNPRTIQGYLGDLINGLPEHQDVSRVLLEHQAKLIIEQDSSAFGFQKLYESMIDGDLRFDELELFNDPAIHDFKGNPEQIERRLEENRKLYQQIQYAVEHHAEELEDWLRDFSPRFINQHFRQNSEKPWQQVTFDEYRAERDKFRQQELEFAGLESEDLEIISRPKSDTKSGTRSIQVIVLTQPDQPGRLTLKFIGDKIDPNEVVLEHNSKLAKQTQFQVRALKNQRTNIEVNFPIVLGPEFLTIRIKRALTTERYIFSCLILPDGLFPVKDFSTVFLVEPRKAQLTLQLEQQLIEFDSSLETQKLTDIEQAVDINNVGVIDFQELYERSDVVSFFLVRGNYSLKVQVEGGISSDGLTLPLLFDKDRFPRLFNDQFNGQFRRTKNKVILDNQEFTPVAERLVLLQLESEFVEHGLCNLSDEKPALTVAALRNIHPEIADAYSDLLAYYRVKKTLPSLASWGAELRGIARRFVSAVCKYLQSVPKGGNLSTDVVAVLSIGTVLRKGEQKLSPFHPLVLSYYVYLTDKIEEDQFYRSFAKLPDVTRRRLNPKGLLPFVYSNAHTFCFTQVQKDNAMWLDIVPQQETSFDFVRKVVAEKIEEFIATFKDLFTHVDDAPLIINSINNGPNKEIFEGILSYFQDHLDYSKRIQVNLYDDNFCETEFDRFAEMGAYDEIKSSYKLDRGKQRENADLIIDLLRTRLSFSKFRHDQTSEQAYAHLAFFRNNQKIERVSRKISEHPSGIACDGLINGESSLSADGRYHTAFGLAGVEYEGLDHLKLAELYGTMWQPACNLNETYHDHSAIGLTVSESFRGLLEKSYDSAAWTTIIDPKVTLEFFHSNKNLILIHYSDQYTNSSSYDAITVTRQTDLYKQVLHSTSEGLIGEFNAFNGEWLLKLVTAPEKIKRERFGIIGAYKFFSALFSQSELTWIPLSVAEMIRVAGNIGLSMSESDFSRFNQGVKAGAISDDVLFVGVSEQGLVLFPVEVKTGSANFAKACEQALSLKKYLEDLLGEGSLAGKLYRGLFIRQLLMQVEKYELYEVFERGYFDHLREIRNQLLKGDYEIMQLPDYPSAAVVAHLDSQRCFETKLEVDQNVLIVELPDSLLPSLVERPLKEVQAALIEENRYRVPAKWVLRGKVQVVAESYPTAESASAELKAAEPTAPYQEDIVVDTASTSSTEETVTTGPLVIQFGENVATGEPVYWEPTNTEKVFNTNMGIIGTMGTGKTQFTKSVITQLYRNQKSNVGGQPIGILIFDYKADYVKDDFVQATNAKVYELYNLPVNPFALFGSKPMLPMHTANLFRGTLATAFGLGNRQQNRIRSLVMEAYDAAGILPHDPSTWTKPAPTLQQVWDLYMAEEKPEQDSLYAALDDLVSFRIFEPDTTKTQSLYDLVDGVTVINLSGYDPKIQNLVVAIMLDIFYSQMHHQGSSRLEGKYRQISKMILVDEADNFMSQNFESLKKILKEGREFGVGTILSTQELTHFKTGENDYASYLLTWVIHRVADLKVQELKAIFNAQNKQDEERLMQEIRQLEKHHSLYVNGQKIITKIDDLAFWKLFG